MTCGPVGGHDDLLLDPRRGDAVLGRAVRLEGDDHALLELDRVVERVEPADDRALVEEQADAVAELEPEALHLVVEPELLGLGPDARDLVGGHARAHQLDRLVDPLARLLVGVALGVVRPADHERPVVAGLVADERLDDVEEGLVAGPDDPVGEDVRMRAAALAAHRVDVVDVLRAEVEQVLRDVGHQLALADPRLELLGDQLVGAVDHRARGVEQDDLVDRLDLARVEHDLLRVADGHALGLERGEHRRLDDVHAERHVDGALGAEDLADLAGGPTEQAGIRCDGAAQPDHPGVDVLRAQPRAVEAMVLRGRAEVPDVRVTAPRQEGVAGHLVARPLADVGARDVADVVEVEQQDGAEVGGVERRRAPAEPIGSQAIDVPALLPVDVHRAGRSEGSRHRVPRADRCRAASESGRLFTHATHRPI